VTPFNRPLQTGAAARFWDPGSLHGAALLNEEITRQARIIAYIDDFKLMLVLSIVVLPLLLLTRASPSDLRGSRPQRVESDGQESKRLQLIGRQAPRTIS
jgi:hypothetical protein